MKFVGSYKKAFGFSPSWHAHFAYAGVMVYAKAANMAGSLEVNPIIGALENLTIELPLGKVTMRARDHQAVMHSLGGRTGRIAVDRNVTFRDLENMTVFRAKEFIEPGEETACSR
jgi:branched-chain amino acid transport system substrate-binding protein